MKISAPPLAAVLLLTATHSMAQLALAPTANRFPLGGMSSPAVLDDATFSCSSPLLVHIPYAACTEQQLEDRESFNGVCPPQSAACKDYMARSLSGANPLGTMAAYNPPDGTQWAAPGCVHIPCALAEDKKKAKDPKPEPGVNDNIQGPPQMLDMPKGGPEGKMLQYPSGRVEYCFDNSCTKTSGTPMTPSEAKKYLKEQYADQKQVANSLNGGGEPINASSGHDDKMGSNSADQTPPAHGGNNPTAYNGGPTAPGGGSRTPGTDSAKNDGADVYNAQRDVASTGGDSGTAGPSGSGGPSGSSGRSGSGGSGSGSWGAGNSGRSGGDDEVIYAPGRKLDEVEVTYRGHQRLEQEIKRTAGTFNTGKLTGFAAPNEPVGGTAGDPPISPEHLGKQQFSANGPSAP